MDVDCLIAEIRKRPGIWNIRCEQYKDRNLMYKLWMEVAKAVGVNVDECKRKWRNLRDAYRAEVRRSERRMKRDKLLGISYEKNNYKSKWAYYDAMDFIRGYKRRSCNDEDCENTNSNSNSNDNDYNDDNTYNDPYGTNFYSSFDIKMEPNHNMADESQNWNDNYNRNELMGDGDVGANDMLFEEFQSINTSQATTRLSTTLPICNNVEQNLVQENEKAKPHLSLSNAYSCKCSNSTNRQVHFAEDMAQSNNFEHIGDADYNFLLSFLPQMKQMNELQNLQFRSKMCNIVLNILSPTTTTSVRTYPIIPALVANVIQQPESSTLQAHNIE